MTIKTALRSEFAGLACIAHARDECRNRDVRLLYYPGEFDYVGVSDGTDCWIAPVSGDPFSVNIRAVMGELRAGKALADIQVVRKRKPLVDAAPAALPARPRPQLKEPAESAPLRPRKRLPA